MKRVFFKNMNVCIYTVSIFKIFSNFFLYLKICCTPPPPDFVTPTQQLQTVDPEALPLIQEVQVKLSTLVEGDQKAPFSIATTQRCRGGRHSFPWIAPLYPWYVPYIAEC